MSQARRVDIPQGLGIRLSNGISPTYDAWEHLMRASLRTYSHCFQGSQSIIDHVFAQTLGEAMVHFTQRMRSDHPQVFFNEKKMFEWLETIFKDTNECVTARIQYGRFRMSSN